MPDPVQPPAPPPQPPVPPPAPLLAGKYKTPEELETGARELFSKTGLINLPKDKPIVGDGAFYATHAELEGAYKKAEALIGKPKEPPADPADPTMRMAKKPEERPADTTDVDVQGLLKGLSLDGNELAKQWTEKGELTPEQYTKFKTKGFTKDMVDGYMDGQQAKATLHTQAQTAMRTDAATIVGGEQQLTNLLAQAHEFVKDPAEFSDIEARLASKSSYKGAIRDLLGHQQAWVAAGNSNKLVESGSPGMGGSGAAKNPTEFRELHKRAYSGDTAALERIMATPDETIRSWGPQQ